MSIDPFSEVGFIGVSIPGNIDGCHKVVKSSFDLPEWTDIPFADWLESRLSIKVNIFNSHECLTFGEIELANTKSREKELAQTLGAALLALKRLNTFDEAL